MSRTKNSIEILAVFYNTIKTGFESEKINKTCYPVTSLWNHLLLLSNNKNNKLNKKLDPSLPVEKEFLLLLHLNQRIPQLFSNKNLLKLIHCSSSGRIWTIKIVKILLINNVYWHNFRSFPLMKHLQYLFTHLYTM